MLYSLLVVVVVVVVIVSLLGVGPRVAPVVGGLVFLPFCARGGSTGSVPILVSTL